jgi:3-isopropylmalate/(R)-2-methylmalate dehydratase small subunit
MTALERTGRVWTFGDAVSIEYISPLRYMFAPEGRGRACLKYLDRDFAAADKDGDLIVAGAHFGHGPGHDHAILAILESGVTGVLATSFAPQFLRHAVVHGLLVAQVPDAGGFARAGDVVRMDFATGLGRNLTRGVHVQANVPGGPAAEIVEFGGLMPFLRDRLARPHPLASG